MTYEYHDKAVLVIHIHLKKQIQNYIKKVSSLVETQLLLQTKTESPMYFINIVLNIFKYVYISCKKFVDFFKLYFVFFYLFC